MAEAVKFLPGDGSRQPTEHEQSAFRRGTGRLLYLGTHQPALTILWQVSVDKRAVLVRHGTTLATLYELLM